MRGQVDALERFCICDCSPKPFDNETNDDDSDTLTNIASVSDNEILLEDLDSDNEMPVMQNSKDSKNDHVDVA